MCSVECGEAGAGGGAGAESVVAVCAGAAGQHELQRDGGPLLEPASIRGWHPTERSRCVCLRCANALLDTRTSYSYSTRELYEYKELAGTRL